MTTIKKQIFSDIKNFSLEILLMVFTVTLSIILGVVVVYPLWNSATNNQSSFTTISLSCIAIFMLIIAGFKIFEYVKLSKIQKAKSITSIIFRIINLVIIYFIFIVFSMSEYYLLCYAMIALFVSNILSIIIKALINRKCEN